MGKKFDFKPGDIIEWCDEEYEVVENYFGDSGVVRQGDCIIRNFHWNYGGVEAKLIRRGEPK